MAVDTTKKKLGDLRVIDLKAELEKRNLATTGNKAALMERLTSAIQEEGEDIETYEFEVSMNDAAGTPKTAVKRTRKDEDDAEYAAGDEAQSFDEQGEEYYHDEQVDEASQDNEYYEGDQDGGEEGTMEDENMEGYEQAEQGDDGAAGKSQPEADTDLIVHAEDNNEFDGELEEKPANDSGDEPKPQRKPPVKKVGKEPVKKIDNGLNVWVTGLPQNTKAAELKKLFAKCGKISSAKIVTNAKAPGTGCYGYVTMSKPEEAKKCVKEFNKKDYNGKVLGVEVTEFDPAGALRNSESVKKAAAKAAAAAKPGSKAPGAVQSKKVVAKKVDSKDPKYGAVKKVDNAKQAPVKTKEDGTNSNAKEDSDEKRKLIAKREKERERRRSRSPIRRPPFRGPPPRRGGFRGGIRRPMFRRGPLPSMRGGFPGRSIPPGRGMMGPSRPMYHRDMIRDREIERRQREEIMRIERERERVKLEREKLERERLELLRLEREKQRLEREKLQRERDELLRQRKLASQMTHPHKRPYEDYNYGSRDVRDVRDSRDLKRGRSDYPASGSASLSSADRRSSYDKSPHAADLQKRRSGGSDTWQVGGGDRRSSASLSGGSSRHDRSYPPPSSAYDQAYRREAYANGGSGLSSSSASGSAHWGGSSSSAARKDWATDHHSSHWSSSGASSLRAPPPPSSSYANSSAGLVYSAVSQSRYIGGGGRRY